MRSVCASTTNTYVCFLKRLMGPEHTIDLNILQGIHNITVIINNLFFLFVLYRFKNLCEIRRIKIDLQDLEMLPPKIKASLILEAEHTNVSHA